MNYQCEMCGKADAIDNGAYCQPCQDKWNKEWSVSQVTESVNFYITNGYITKEEMLAGVQKWIGEQK